MAAPAFIANPARDANMTIQVKVARERVGITGKTMHHDRIDPVPIFREDCGEVICCVPLVQE